MTFFDNLSIRSKIVTALSVVILVMVGASVVTHIESSQIRQTTKWTEHTDEVVEATNHLLSAMVDQETSLRGFLLSGDNAFLVPYRAGAAEFDRWIAKGRQLTTDDAAQQARFAEIQKLSETWHRESADRAIALMASSAARSGRMLRTWLQADRKVSRPSRPTTMYEASGFHGTASAGEWVLIWRRCC